MAEPSFEFRKSDPQDSTLHHYTILPLTSWLEQLFFKKIIEANVKAPFKVTVH